MIETPLPLEQTDPEVGQFLQDVANKKNPHGIKSVVEIENDVVFIPTQIKPIKVGRNDSCPCNSGRKYKKCCGKI